MSIKTWKAEFYKVKPKATMTDLVAIRHCLLKWTGLKKSNLAKHGLEAQYGDILDDHAIKNIWFEIDSNNCALCIKHMVPENSCDNCPLAIINNGLSCCSDGSEQNDVSPYGQWCDNNDPKPMIALLKKAEKAYSIKKKVVKK